MDTGSFIVYIKQQTFMGTLQNMLMEDPMVQIIN